MLYQDKDPYSRLPSKYDFSQWLESLQNDRNWSPYATTIIHKNGDTPGTANLSLKRFVPRFFSKTISRNWTRLNCIRNILLVMFLEPPGARYRNHVNRFRMASAQNNYHHHGILLLDPSLVTRFEGKAWFLMADPAMTLKTNHEPLGAIPHAILQNWQRQKANEFLRPSTARSCYIEKIYDFNGWSTYAAKTVSPMQRSEWDSAMAVFPQYV